MKINYRQLKILFFIALALVGVVAFLSSPVLAAELNLGLEPVGAEIALPIADIRVVIVRIINIALGFLGILVVLLMLYGGFTWMTAGGDEKKIETAKKIITNAVIGLIIIILSFAISSFILRRLQEAVGGAGPGGPAGGRGPGAGGLPAGAFYTRAITPSGATSIRNVTVRAIFSSNVDSATLSGNLTVARASDSAVVSGRLTASSNVAEFVPDTPCPDANNDGAPDAPACFSADTDFRVIVSTGLRDDRGRPLQCGGLAPSCEGAFRTGSLVDTAPPSVQVTSPDDGANVPADSLVPLQAFGSDDSGVSYIEFSVDGRVIDSDAPTGGYADVEWDSTGASAGRHTISARAYDLDNNSAVSSPVNVSVRPAYCFNGVLDGDETAADCGGSCGACAASGCSSDADCSSGNCSNGICVETPRIDEVAPLDGQVGSLITISGAFFGDSPGRVLFRSATGETVATGGVCSDYWRDNQIVAAVPEGAIDGPIRVEASSGESDSTSDARGPVMPDFDVNNVLRPGICRIVPASARPDETFTLEGTGFGSAAPGANVSFGGRTAVTSSWADASIAGAVPRIASGRVPVQVTVGGGSSNPVYFNVLSLSAGREPQILEINPSAGPKGEYITLSGDNFGETVGTVTFRNPVTNDEARADVDLPEACATDFWRNNSITVKVPRRYNDGRTELSESAHSVTVVRSDGANSNAIDFAVTAGTAKPGLCAINPDNGPAGTDILLSGERFGVARGAVIFSQNQRVSPPEGAWNDEEIRVAVPEAAVTGPVKVVVGSQESNPLNFAVQNCNQSACDAGFSCCQSSGTCVREGESCAGAALSGGYAWRISTGPIPTTPRVVEECREAVSPSPSPWDARRGGNNVCVNAAINVRFTVDMDSSSLVPGNIVVERCLGEGAEPCASRELVTGRVDASVRAIRFVPLASLNANATYLVTLTTGLRAAGAAGGAMEENAARCGAGNAYCFRFKTRPNAENCAIGSSVMDPADFVSREQEDLAYVASALAGDDICVSLNADAYDWIWSVREADGSLLSGINPEARVANNDNLGGGADGLSPDGRVDSRQSVSTLAETIPDPPVYVHAAAAERTGRGRLTIDFTDPEIVESWPACDSACVNAEVAARFNTAMDAASFAGNAFLQRCANESCRLFDQDISVSPSYDEDARILRIEHPALEPSRYYRVRIGNAARSRSGVNLTRLNYGNYYSWIFRTKDDSAGCGVASVDVSPASIQLYYLGARQTFRSAPISPPDECSPSGQRLTPTDYSWGWDVSNRNVAELLDDGALNVLPTSGVNGCSDKCLRVGSSAGIPVCGNGGAPERGEDCDDGNTVSRDGCSEICLSEGSDFGGSDCGDGNVGVGEDCDDGNTTAGDGCGSYCLNEGSTAGGSLCGNNDLGDGEDCDDGNTTGGDGCSAECLDEGSIKGPMSVCGNRVIEAGEDCDDGNTAARDGCSSRCLNEGRPACANGNRANCCGNGITDNFEDFDDGNTTSGDGYSNRCLAEGSSISYNSICGNGSNENDLEAGEECEFTSRDNLVDPLQYAEARNQGETSVNASTAGQRGSANLRVQCVCQNDSMCASGGFPPGLGCGADKCCSARPRVEEVSPLDGSRDACRNALLTAKFSTLMDATSFTSATVRLDSAAVAGACPQDSALVDGVWCEGGAGELRLGARAVTEVVGEMAEEKTILQISGASALRANTGYRARIIGDPNIGDNATQGVKSKTGVGMDGNYIWTFSTGSDICSLDEAEIAPSPVTFLTTADPDGTKTVAVRALSRRNGNLVEIAGMPEYDWEWSWADSDAIEPESKIISRSAGARREEQTISSRPRNGQITLTATAEIITDTFFTPTTARRLVGPDVIPGRRVSDTSLVIVNLCENPWPERIGGFWEPFTDGDMNFSLFYCRDRGNQGTADDLPGLIATRVPAPPSPNIIREYLFAANPCPEDGTGCEAGDALGMRIAANGEHLSPRDWYYRQGFRGSPSSRVIDGYAGLEDGRTVYVNAANKIGDPVYTNIYIVSYNEGAGDDVVAARDQILANWKLSTNVGSARRCVDADGLPMTVGEGAERNPAVCLSDADCRGIGEPPRDGFCDASGDKLRRDAIRLGDVRSMEIALNAYKNSHKHCSRNVDRICIIDSNCPSGEQCVGDYPRMTAGTFIPSLSVSKWPSWQNLGSELGVTLPNDPLNNYSSCPDGALRATCWNSQNQTYACNEFSNVYHYRNRGGTRYDLSAELEFGPLPHEVADGVADSALRVNLWAPLPTGPIIPGETTYELNFNEQCQGVTLSANNLCGDGVVGPDEQCEAPSSDIVSCEAGGRAGFANLTCGADCRWFGTQGCQTGRCGDGVRQEPEICDDGVRNGSYGRCNVSCTGIGDRCGDGGRQGPEVCDEGQLNGQYNHCAWDCRSNPGTYCGDKVKNGTEECDGEKGVANVEGLPVCGANAQGFPTGRNCRSDCGWSGCEAMGFCGNGLKEGREECDDGNANNTDGCIIISGRESDLAVSCRNARCGDGFTYNGTELCDAGPENGVSCVPGYGVSCNYCTNLCNPATISGGSCGDGRVSGPEVCDGNLKANNQALLNTETCHGNCLAICPPTFEERGATWRKAALADGVAPSPSASVEVAANEEATLILPACRSSSGERRCIGGTNAGNVCTGEIEGFCDVDCAYQCPGGRCGEAHPITADLAFTEAELSPIDVVFVTDLSGSMNVPDASCDNPDESKNCDMPGGGTDTWEGKKCSVDADCVRPRPRRSSIVGTCVTADTRIECAKDAQKKAIDSLFDAYPRGLIHIGLVSFKGNSATMDTPEVCGEGRLCDDPTAHRRALKDIVDAYVASGGTPTSRGVDDARCILLGSRPDSQDVLHNNPFPNCPDVPITRDVEDLRNNIKTVLLMSDGAPSGGFNPAAAATAIKTSHTFTEGNEEVVIPPSYVYSMAFTNSTALIKDMIDWSSDCRTFGVSEWNAGECLFSDGAAGSADDLNAHNADTTHEEYGYSSTTDLTPLYTAIIGSITGVRVILENGNEAAATEVAPGGDRPLFVPANFSCNPNRATELAGRILYKGRGTMRVSDTKLSACFP